MNNHTYNKLDDILQAEYKRGYEAGYAARKEVERKRKEEEARRMKRQVKAYVMISNIPSEVDRFVVARRDEDGALWFYGSYAEARNAEQCMDELDNAILLDVVQE